MARLRYQQEGAEPVLIDSRKSIRETVMADNVLMATDVVRHDPEKLARALLRIMVQRRPKWAEGRLIDSLWLENRLRERRKGSVWDGLTREK